MERPEFAYMLQPSVEKPESYDQITWVQLPMNAMPADAAGMAAVVCAGPDCGPDGDRDGRRGRDGRDGDRDGPEEGITMRVNDDGMRMSMAGDGSSISVEVGEDGMFLRMASALGLGASVGAGLAGLALNI